MSKVDFGFKKVATSEKENLVKGVFSSVAGKYDIMNDIMSFGLHYLWKDRLMQELYPWKGHNLIDVASGTLDIAKKFLQNKGAAVKAVDINAQMLEAGYKKLLDDGFVSQNLEILCANAEELPIDDNSFDYYTISFGIRNVTHKDKALQEAHRVLKPGGKFVCLEFSNINNDLLRSVYNFYAFNVVPKIGKAIANDAEAYQYLVESIARFPAAQRFANFITEAGFENVSYTKMTFGVVALHVGYKI